MKLSSGRPEIKIGLIDGPVDMEHEGLDISNIREVAGRGACSRVGSNACNHGTFVAGILHGKRGSAAPSICPGCTLLVYPIFSEESGAQNDNVPSATPENLADAITVTVDAGANLLNLSVGLTRQTSSGGQKLEEALNYAARHGVICVAAAGNQGMIGSTAITRHPWVIPVVACDEKGSLMSQSNLGNSIGNRGLTAPGVNIASFGPGKQTRKLTGSSLAAAIVTGTIALLWSLSPAASAAEVRSAVCSSSVRQNRTIVPPLLDAWASHQMLAQPHAVHGNL